MTVYVRTDQGQEAAYKPDSVLPRKLRSILKLIDGRTTLQMLEQNLQSFGDIRAILHSLTEEGFIRALPDGAQHLRVNMHASDEERQRLMDPSNAGDWLPTRSAYAAHSTPGFAPVGQSNVGQYAPFSDAQVSADDSQRTLALKAVVDDMAGFVLTHMPDESFALLKEIEEITSMELLAVTLGGYEQMVSHLGAPSEEHIKYIKRVLQNNM